MSLVGVLSRIRLDGTGPLADTGYWVRQLTPGWPPQFHAAPPKGVEMVEIPVTTLEAVGALLVVAILALATITFVIGRKTKRTRPR